MATPENVPKSSHPSAPSAVSPTADADSGRRRSQFNVMLGLLLTFAGLFAYALQIPSRPAMLDTVAPWLAIGFIAVWTGGILFGNSQIPPPPDIPPALRSQVGISLLAVLAGALSQAVVIQRLGPWTTTSPGLPNELIVALVGPVLVWIGGYLMGHSMRRFVRRRRRGGSSGAL